MTDAASQTSLTELSARALARGIAARAFSAREVVTAFLERIDRYNPIHNAVVSLRPRADLLAEAEAADAAVRRGDPLGALHGLPVAVKDLAATVGLRTTLGSPLFADWVPDADALHVARMRAAGALIIGKTNTPEYGLGSHTVNPVFGATRNAFDPSRSAGGSSGGAAVALARAMLPVADGSDFGGSLRNPAGWNAVFGFRPSQGRVPALSVPDAFLVQLATDGPMGRTVEDVATLLSVQAGWDPRAPGSLADPGFRYEDRLDGPPPAARVAWLGDLGGHLPVEDGILGVCETALARLAELGCTVAPVALPGVDFEALWRAFVVLRQVAVGGRLMPAFADPARRALLNPQAVWECEGFLRLSARDVHEASAVRTAWYARALDLFAAFDVLALPTAQVWPFPVEWAWPRAVAGRAMDSYHRWMEVVVPATLLGCPTAAVPAGFGGPGGFLPMGLQLVGRPRDDLSVLQLAHAYERASPWIAAARRGLD